MYVETTDSWMAGDLADRRSNLNTIYKMWRAAQTERLTKPVQVWIRDRDGRVVMRKP